MVLILNNVHYVHNDFLIFKKVLLLLNNVSIYLPLSTVHGEMGHLMSVSQKKIFTFGEV